MSLSVLILRLPSGGVKQAARLPVALLSFIRGRTPSWGESLWGKAEAVTREGLGQTSLRRKLIGYRETWRQGIHRTHLGIPNFRVLTVTTTGERMRNLA